MRSTIILLLAFLVVPAAQLVSAEDVDRQASPEAVRARASDKWEKRPDLSKIHSPQLAQALMTPEALWKFITAPETEYSNRMAAAIQGAAVFPLSWLPRLLAAQADLGKENGLHGWGLKRDLRSAVLPSELPLDRYLATGLPRERQVLDHRWVVPEKARPHPLSWEDESQAPWPWQVQQVFGLLYACLPKGPAWLEETLTFPWGTDAEARTFVRLSNDSSHYKTVSVMARWRRICLDPSKPEAAQDVAMNLRSAVRLWNDPVSQTVGQVILTDIIRSSPHESAKQQVAYWLGEQRNAWRDSKNLRMPLPVTSVLAVSKATIDPARGDQ